MGGQAVAGAKPLRFLSLDEMTSEPAPIEWLVRGYLEAQTLSVLFGASGSMKSFLAIDLGMSIATGTPWHGFRVQNPGSVLYIAGEGFQGLRKRLRAWSVAHDVQHAPFYTAERGVQFPDKTAAAEVRQEAQRLEQPPQLIIIDTLSRSLVGDENNAADMSAFIQGLDELRHDLQCAILIVHHSGWSEKERSRGSSALRAALDFEYRLDVHDEIRLLKATKVKDHEHPPDLAFEVEEVATGWTDPETGDEINSCVLRRSEAPEALKPKPKLTGATRIAFEALVGCTNRRRDEGGNIDLGTVKIHLDEWRTKSLSGGLSASTDTESKKRAFRRAVRTLLDKGFVATNDDYYWINE
ncbi:hypothetical protein DPQ33_12625 [Oceanidesulfovibrio indonesiensis]|uniref:AAA+ ATPase domain-containing protein n=2 Tax=Oceanidesulfovibrio indonesiensis TaxID=54767 RepID=A0A7M3MD75_9BACT|nr:hypothetical protein DPQ33_12625 [Oceanidesulfovibrio indonesiensis]